MKIDFNNKTVVVTGGAGGIGLACTQEFLASNARVIVLDLDDAPLKETFSNNNLFFYKVDISNIEQTENIIKEICQSHGPIETLVQTAGILRSVKGLSINRNDWDLILDINARGTFFVMQQIVKYSMQEHGGAIVNIASMAGMRGMRPELASAHYSASKGAVIAMSKQAATEWACYNVRCNSISPGGVITKAMEFMEFLPDAFDAVPLKKLSKPEDIANSVVFLASDKAAMITGQNLVVDGGSSAVGY